MLRAQWMQGEPVEPKGICPQRIHAHLINSDGVPNGEKVEIVKRFNFFPINYLRTCESEKVACGSIIFWISTSNFPQ